MLEGVGGKGENRTHTSGFADRLTTTVDLPMNPHKTNPAWEGSIPKNFYHVIGGRIAMTTISLVVFRGIEPQP